MNPDRAQVREGGHRGVTGTGKTEAGRGGWSVSWLMSSGHDSRQTEVKSREWGSGPWTGETFGWDVP